MNSFRKKIRITHIFILFSLFGTAQNIIDDSQIWSHLKLKKEINKKLDLNVKLQGRFTNNISELGRFSANSRINYKLYKNIKLIVGYVFIEKKNNNNIFKTRHSYYGGVEIKKDVRRFEFSYRNLFVCRYKSPFTSYDGYIAYYSDRNRITIKYEYSKRLTLYAMEDINIPLNNPQLKGISRSRTYAGAFININKKQKLQLYIMYHLQLQQGDWFDQDISYVNSPMNRHIAYGVGYNIEF